MLQRIRDNAQGWIAKVIIGVIAFTFAIFGLESLGPSRVNPEVASVNGEAVTAQQLAEEIDKQRRFLLQQLGSSFDQNMVQDSVLRNAALESIISKMLMLQFAKDNDMVVSDELIDKVIRSYGDFQIDGKFNKDHFKVVLNSLKLTPVQLREILNNDIVISHIKASIIGSAFKTPYEFEVMQKLKLQKRDIEWVTLSLDSIKKDLSVSQEEIEEFYSSHNSLFMTEEKVILEYVLLKKSNLLKEIVVTDEDIALALKKKTKQLKEEYSHRSNVFMILVETKPKRSESEALEIADKLKKELDNGIAFEKLVSEYSEDPVSVKKEGNIGEVIPGIFGDAFDNALSELSIGGQPSYPVVTRFGVVLLKRVEITNLVVEDDSELDKESVINNIKEQYANDRLISKAERLAEIVYESIDLQDAADEIDLEIVTTKPIMRSDLHTGITSNKNVLNAAFSDDVLKLKMNSELIEIDPEQMIVIRVKEHFPALVIPLNDIKDTVKNHVLMEQGTKKLAERSEVILSKLRAGSEIESIPEFGKKSWISKKSVEREGQDGIDSQITASAFKLARPVIGESKEYTSVSLPKGDIAIVTISNVVEGEQNIPNNIKIKARDKVGMDDGSFMFSSLKYYLREQAEVDIMDANELVN